ncbi:unnamed protein product [Camellia sinensis]
MGGSTSQRLIGSSCSDDCVDLSHSFHSLGLKEEDGFITICQESDSQSNNGIASSSSPTSKEDDTNHPQFKKPSSTLSISQENIWENHSSINGGDALVSDMYSGSESSMGPLNYLNHYDLDYELNNFPGNFSGQAANRNSCYERPSGLSDLASPYPGMGDCGLNYDPELDYPVGSLVNYNEFNTTGSNGYYSGNGCRLSNGMASSIGLLNQQGGYCDDLICEFFLQRSDVSMLARCENGSKFLQSLLQKGNPVINNTILNGVFEFLFELLTDEYGRYVFQRLIEKCDYSQLQLVVLKITLQNALLIEAAFTRNGSQSIQKLIKQVKKLDLAKQVTSALSTRSFELMTRSIGRHVIQQCFILLDSQTNEVLFEAVIERCVELAMDPVGCISLNECINSITGQQRRLLLDRISLESVCLSFDPSGNYVVQHILGLDNSELNDKICFRLRGRYARLSLIKHGSHVVEKCLQFSPLAIVYLVEDTKKQKGMLEKIARDQFGNYVIQTALKISKRESFSELHEFLVKNLQQHLPNLEKTKAGTNVARLIREQTSSKSKF